MGFYWKTRLYLPNINLPNLKFNNQVGKIVKRQQLILFFSKIFFENRDRATFNLVRMVQNVNKNLIKN